MARRFARTNVLEISFAGFTWMMFFMVSLFSMLNGAMWVLGYDPTWAGTKASMACMKISWMDIYRDMMVEHTVRASGMIMGRYTLSLCIELVLLVLFYSQFTNEIGLALAFNK